MLFRLIFCPKNTLHYNPKRSFIEYVPWIVDSLPPFENFKDTYDIVKDFVPEKGEQHKIRVTHILTRLNTPFVPPVVPKWGPIFPRLGWQKQFETQIRSDFYHAYYGSSGTGKSVAISEVLKMKRGIIYLNLRRVQSTEKIWEQFAIRSGYFGTEVTDKELVNDESFLQAYSDASNIWKKKSHYPPILFVEDIHQLGSEINRKQLLSNFAGATVDLYSNGLANVVFTVSDYNATHDLQSISGHSSRFSYSLFPDIPDEELERLLTQLVIQEDIKQIDKTRTIKEKILLFANIKNSTDSVLVKEDEVKLIIKNIGSHMDDLVEVLKDFVVGKVPVQDSIKRIIDREAPKLAALFTTTKNPLLVLTTYLIFEDMKKSPNHQSSFYEVIRTYNPQIKSVDINKVINILVDKNLLTYVDFRTVKPHARRCLVAWKDVKELCEVKATIESAMKEWRRKES